MSYSKNKRKKINKRTFKNNKNNKRTFKNNKRIFKNNKKYKKNIKLIIKDLGKKSKKNKKYRRIQYGCKSLKGGGPLFQPGTDVVRGIENRLINTYNNMYGYDTQE